jgi:hypothetical protein
MIYNSDVTRGVPARQLKGTGRTFVPGELRVGGVSRRRQISPHTVEEMAWNTGCDRRGADGDCGPKQGTPEKKVVIPARAGVKHQGD